MASTENEHTRLDSRAIILQAGLQLFSAQGYDSTSIDDIRQAAGFKSKASLYTHFKSKEEVAVALIQKILDEANQVVMQAYARATAEPLHQMQALGGAFIRWGMSHPQEYAFCFVRAQQEMLIQGKVAYYTESQRQSMGQVMLKLIADLRKEYPVRHIADTALMSMMLGIISRAVVDQTAFGTIDQETKAQQVFEMCLGILFRESVSLSE